MNSALELTHLLDLMRADLHGGLPDPAVLRTSLGRSQNLLLESGIEAFLRRNFRRAFEVLQMMWLCLRMCVDVCFWLLAVKIPWLLSDGHFQVLLSCL